MNYSRKNFRNYAMVIKTLKLTTDDKKPKKERFKYYDYY